VKYYGIRRQTIEEGELIKHCLKRQSVRDQVGNREFPLSPTFHSPGEAYKWAGIMAARYTEERLRLSVEVLPKDATEFLNLSKLELGERVELELTGTEPTSSKLYITAGKHCIIERIEHVPTDGFVSAFVFDLLDSSYYDADPVPPSGFLNPAELSPTGE
jgi:hypothetical protein